MSTTDPFARFTNWFAEAEASEPADANAFSLATIEQTADGPRPDVRIVLLKGYDANGFVFYTNYESAKGRQLTATGFAAINFHWKSLRRQVRASGRVHRVSSSMSDSYFATRPRESQLSAWASRQSAPLAARDEFEARLREMDQRFLREVPRPPFWGGWQLVPDWIEFWEDRPGRQHHRERFTRTAGDTPGWEMALLYP